MKRLASTLIALLCMGILQARAETVDVPDDHGGSVSACDARWSGLEAKGVNVRLVGPCQSACTVLIGHIPHSRICVTPQARFGFHLAHLPSAQATLWAAYTGDIRDWIEPHGGLHDRFIWMSAPDTYRYFPKC